MTTTAKNTKIKEILAKAGDRSEIAQECGVEEIAVYRWGQNSSIPSRHLAGILRVSERNNAGVTADMLCAAHEATQ